MSLSSRSARSPLIVGGLLLCVGTALAGNVHRAIVTRTQPIYPELAHRMQVGGKVVLMVTVQPDGSVSGTKVESTERVDKMITQIAIAASQQAVAADQSSASLHSIHSLSHGNLTEMATTTAGVESLRATATALEQQVDRFHLQSTVHAKSTHSITPPTHHVIHTSKAA